MRDDQAHAKIQPWADPADAWFFALVEGVIWVQGDLGEITIIRTPDDFQMPQKEKEAAYKILVLHD